MFPDSSEAAPVVSTGPRRILEGVHIQNEDAIHEKINADKLSSSISTIQISSLPKSLKQ